MTKTPIDELLRFIARNRVTLAQLLALRSRRWKYWLRVLRQKKLVRAHTGVFSTRTAIYQLTAKGCKRAGVSVNRSRPYGPEALAKHLTLAVFLATHRNYRRWSRKRLKRVLGVVPPGVHLEHDRVIWLVYCPGEDTGVRYVLRRLHERIEQANQLVSEWIPTGKYGFLILADNEPKAEQLRKAIDDIEARVEVCVAPGPRTIPLALKGLSNGKA